MSNSELDNLEHINNINISSDVEVNKSKGDKPQLCRFVDSGIWFGVGTDGISGAVLAVLFCEVLVFVVVSRSLGLSVVQ